MNQSYNWNAYNNQGASRLSVIAGNRCTAMNRIVLLVLTITATFSSIAETSGFHCVIDTQRNIVAAAPVVSLTGTSFSVDTITGELHGLRLLEFQLMQNPKISGDTKNGSFRVEFDSADNRFLNYLVVYPIAKNLHRKFSLILGVADYSGTCLPAPDNQINNNSAPLAALYFYGRNTHERLAA